MEAVYGALKLGYDVVFSDVDVIILKDPIEYLFYPSIDYVHSVNNGGCNRPWSFYSKHLQGNTGIISNILS